jgi:hypothetical protein
MSKKKLLENGFSKQFIDKLSYKSINVLLKQINSLKEQTKTGSVIVSKNTDSSKIRDLASKGLNVKISNEMKEDEEDPMDFEKGQRTQDPHQVGPSTDDGFGNYGDGMDEGEMTEKKQTKNPWAICTATMGKKFGSTERSDWSKNQMKQYERCVMDVKKQIKENKNPIIPILENITRNQIKTNLLPQTDKATLIEMIAQNQSIIKRPLHNNKQIGKYKMNKKSQIPVFSITKEKLESDLKEIETTENKIRDLVPNPGKVKIPDYLTFDQLNIKFKK